MESKGRQTILLDLVFSYIFILICYSILIWLQHPQVLGLVALADAGRARHRIHYRASPVEPELCGEIGHAPYLDYYYTDNTIDYDLGLPIPGAVCLIMEVTLQQPLPDEDRP